MIDFPNSPAVGALFTVGTATWKWDGVKWVPAWPTTPGSTTGGSWPPIPTIASTGLDTWINQGSSTIADDPDVGIILDAINGAGDQLRCRVKSAPPTPPYKCQARLLFDFQQTNFQLFGLGFYNSVTRHILAIEFGEVSGLFGRVVKYDSPTSLNTNVGNIQTPNFYGPFWIQIEDDGTTVYLRMGISGKRFRHTSFSEARTSWMAGLTQPIIYINAINNPSSGIICGWQQTP